MRPFPAKLLASEFQQVNEANVSWQAVCFLRSFCVGVRDVHEAIASALGILLLANVGGRQHHGIATAKGLAPDEAADAARFGAPFLPKGVTWMLAVGPQNCERSERPDH